MEVYQEVEVRQIVGVATSGGSTPYQCPVDTVKHSIHYDDIYTVSYCIYNVDTR